MDLIRNFTRKSLQQWAKTGRAPGYLHQVVDRYSPHLSAPNLVRRVYQNKKIACNLSDHVQSRIYFFGAYEPIEAFLFTSLIKPDSHIVDAGANIGFYSLVSESFLGQQGMIYAFEPVPHNYNQLLKNIELSQSSNIKVFKKGLWNKTEVLEFSLDAEMENNAGSFTLGNVQNAREKVKCEVTTLDSLVQEKQISKVDLIKMDIEGAELMAIEGAQQTIDQFRPSVLMEINQGACQRMNYSSSKIDKIFLQKGYKIFLVNTLPENSGFIESTEKLTQSNVFYISPNDQTRFHQQWDPRKVRKMFARN